MYFYHESYHDAHHAAALEHLHSDDRRNDDLQYEPIRTPAILNWLVSVAVALCVAFTVIHGLS